MSNALTRLLDAVAEYLTDPTGYDKKLQEDKAKHEADLAFIQKLCRDRSVLQKSPLEVLELINAKMTSRMLGSMHEIFTKKVSQAKPVETGEMLLKFEEALTGYMTNMAPLYFHRRA